MAPLLARSYRVLSLSHAAVDGAVLLAVKLDNASVAVDPERHALPVCNVLCIWLTAACGMLLPAAVQALLERNTAAEEPASVVSLVASTYRASGALWALACTLVPLFCQQH